MSPVVHDHMDGCSTKQDTITIMETAPATTETISPLGDLSRFPREIRDEIYRNVFPKRHKVLYSWSMARDDYYDEFGLSDSYLAESKMSFGPHFSISSILVLSKTIKDEAMAFLFSDRIFCFYPDVTRKDPDKSVPQHSTVDTIKQMTNIEVCYRARLMEPRHYRPAFRKRRDASPRYDSAEAGPLNLFLGNSSLRKSALIGLELDKSEIQVTAINSPLFRAMKKLTGFKTVTLRLTASPYFPPQGTNKAILKEWFDAGQWEKLYAGFEPLLSAMSKDLEPALGNSVMSEFVCEERGQRGYREIVFHPRDRLAEIPTSKKDTMSKEQAMSTDRPIGSDDTESNLGPCV